MFVCQVISNIVALNLVFFGLLSMHKFLFWRSRYHVPTTPVRKQDPEVVENLHPFLSGPLPWDLAWIFVPVMFSSPLTELFVIPEHITTTSRDITGKEVRSYFLPIISKNCKKILISGILDYSRSYCNTLLAAIKISKTKIP